MTNTTPISAKLSRTTLGWRVLLALLLTASCGETGSGGLTGPAPTGALELSLSGLPAGVAGRLIVIGPNRIDTLTSSRMLSGLTPGQYQIAAQDVDADDVTLLASPAFQTIAVSGGGTASAHVDYHPGAPRSGSLTVAVVSTAIYFAPRLVVCFVASHPGIKVRLLDANREQVLRLLGESAVELAVMGEPPEGSRLDAAYFADHPLGIVAAPGHRLVSQPRVEAAALAGEVFVLREAGSGTRRTMERFFAAAGVGVAAGMEMSSNEAVKQAVMAGLGLGFLSLHTVGLELSTGRLRVLDVRDLPVRRRWNLCARRDRLLSPAALAFRRFVADRGAALLLEGVLGRP